MHTVLSFRFFGVIWILVFEMLFCRVESAFHRTHRNIQPLCDLRLGHFLPEVQVENLLVLIAQQLQCLPHGIRY